MARTPSTMVPLQTQLPAFSLPDAVSGRTFRQDDLLESCGLLVLFICNHCPFVIHVQDELTRIAAEYGQRGLGVVAINANSAISHPQDGPVHMRALADQKGWRFPFLFDESQDTARAFGAACTPDIFVYDGAGALFYRGQLDDTRPGGATPDGRDLRAALDALLQKASPPNDQKPSLGCNIKWHPV